jgi:hypothetical protein
MDKGWPPVSHTGDPETSKGAEAATTRSGTRNTHAQHCLRIVRETPGMTTGEIGEMSGLGQAETRRRLSDLKARKQAYMGPPRIWRGSGRPHSTWWPVGEFVQQKMSI